MPRADKFTAASKQIVYYSDIKADFSTRPQTGELDVVLNDDSVKQSLKYLILTTREEVPYNPLRGSKIKTILHEPFDDISLGSLREAIHETLRLEPRANIIDVQIEPNEEKYEYGVTIAFSIINITGKTFVLDMILSRIRLNAELPLLLSQPP